MNLVTYIRPFDFRFASQKVGFPFTIVYGSLEIISLCYSYLSAHIGNEQY